MAKIYEEEIPQANATAYGTGIGDVRVYVDPKTNRTQASGFLPGKGVMIVPDNSKYGWKITGVNDNGTYQSEKVDLSANTAGGITPSGPQSVDSMYSQMYKDIVTGQDRITGIAVNQLSSQKKGVHSAYDASARNAYTNYMMNNKNLNESLIRAGLAEGGMSESSQVASNAAYGAELMQNETSRNQAINDIDSKIADVRQQGEAAKLEAKNTLGLKKIDYYTEREQADRDRAWYLEDVDRDRAWDVEDANRDRAWDVEDANRDRAWDVEDANRDRAWDVQDANRNRAWERQDRADDNYQKIRDGAFDELINMASRGITTPPEYLLEAAGITFNDYRQMFDYYH